MITRLQKLKNDVAFVCQPRLPKAKTIIARPSPDGCIEYVEFKKIPSTLKASDFSIENLQLSCPDMLKPCVSLSQSILGVSDMLESQAAKIESSVSQSVEPQNE